MSANPAPRRGRFYVLDGVDGCGKTTQAERLVRALGAAGTAPLHVREPGSTRLGERLRELLLDPRSELSTGTEALLFAAARREMLAQVVAPTLALGRDVLCERFHPSTFAYQAVAGGLDEEAMLALLAGWAGDPRPDLVLVLDLPVEEAHRRACERGASDRIEARGLAFQRRVAEGFRRYAERVPGTVVVDASGSAEEVAERILEEVRRAHR